MSRYDVIVVGVGSMGSATCYELARRGLSVLGLEQFQISHNRGSHAGQSRLIRKAYFEHPGYVPLLHRAYELWDEIEEKSGQNLLHQNGIAYFGRPEGELLSGVRRSASIHGLTIEDLADVKSRFPEFTIPSDMSCIYESAAGFVQPEKSIRTFTSMAKWSGAEIRENCTVISWENAGDNILVQTNSGTFEAGKLIFTSGAYTSKLVTNLPFRPKVTQQLLAWFTPQTTERLKLGNFPCWMIEEPGTKGAFYGFPVLDDSFGEPFGLKIAHHRPMTEISPEQILEFDPHEEVRWLTEALKRYIPAGVGELVTAKSCLYTYSPDENFALDFLPGSDGKVLVACGFSGHGFKFIPVIGEIMADLVVRGNSSLPIEFLRLNRF